MHRTVTGLSLAIGLAAASVVTASAQQYGRYGYNNAPPGSYQQSCDNVQVRGSTLSASCTAANGQRVYSTMNVNGCNGDIANNNGRLQCNGNYGYNGGYNNGGYNNGRYNGNGRDGDDQNDGDDNRGERHHHHGHGNGYGNGNGYYGNGNRGYGNGNGYGNGYGLPGGSYQQSCTNEHMNGSTLYASCTAPNGQYINSSINVNRCPNAISNRNGYLSCG